MSFDADMPDELVDTAELLRQERPELGSENYERIRRRIRGPATAKRTPSLAVTLCLALGIVFSTAGSGMAVSGFVGNDRAVQAQYPEQQLPQVTPQPPQAVSPTGPAGFDRGPGGEEGQVLGLQEGGSERAPAPVLGGGTAGVQTAPPADGVARQLEAESRSDLPFTGFDAIPILAAGIVLLAMGALLRRRSGRLV